MLSTIRAVYETLEADRGPSVLQYCRAVHIRAVYETLEAERGPSVLQCCPPAERSMRHWKRTWSRSVIRVVSIQRDLANLFLADLIWAEVSIVVLVRGLKEQMLRLQAT